MILLGWCSFEGLQDGRWSSEVIFEEAAISEGDQRDWADLRLIRGQVHRPDEWQATHSEQPARRVGASKGG